MVMTKNKNFKYKIEHLYDASNKEVGGIIKYKDFQKVMAKLEELHDIHEYYKRKSQEDSKKYSLSEIKKELFGKHAKK